MTPTPHAVVLASKLESLPEPSAPEWRYWLTGAELQYCHGKQRAQEHLAARLLAKRALATLLGWPDGTALDQIEITRPGLAAPVVRLAIGAGSGPEPGNLAVSLTHGGGWAAALAWSDQCLPGA